MEKNKSVKTILARVPWFYFLISIYPIIFLWAYNKTQINIAVVFRSLIITIIAACLMFVILYFMFRNTLKAALYGTMLLILFFSYGRIYYWIRNIFMDVSASRHRVLVVVYGILFLAGTWLVFKWWFRLKRIQSHLNAVSFILVVIPVMQLGIYYGSIYISSHQVSMKSTATSFSAEKDLPDIYFIVLDSYMRSDAMLMDFGYDNSEFIDELRQIGFFVANCSRPNYGSTELSLPTTLNMNYLLDLIAAHPILDNKDFSGFYVENNKVREILEDLGYTSVAFRTDYLWTGMSNADIFLGMDPSSVNSDISYQFEDMYLKSTAALLFVDINSKLHISQYILNKFFAANNTYLPGPDFRYNGHVDTVLFTLKHLPNVVDIPGPKFVYVHLLIPHFPYVFAPDGSLLTDPGYYSGELGEPINIEYRRKGYIFSVQYINNRILPVLGKIISDSSIPPIIVVEGDHGLSDNNRFTNLLAFYLPDGNSALYSTITPVNSFRLIMAEYFGLDYLLLPDITYKGNEIVPETYPGCIH